METSGKSPGSPAPATPSTPEVDVLDPNGKVRDRLALNPAVFGVAVHGALLHQAVVRELAGQRAGTHDTRGRSEVSGGGRKPWRQKGTGRARQGSIRATQWKGGGKPFGPTPRRYTQRMPRAARRAALRAALSARIAGGGVAVVEEVRLAAAKTKALVATLSALGTAGRRTLLVVAEPDLALARASRNVPGLRVAQPGQVSVADLLRHERVIFERRALVLTEEALRA